MSDEALHAERDALLQRNFSNAKLRGYRGRVTSPDYHVEMQMQQLDKQQAADDQAKAERIQQELIRRGHARAKDERAAEAAERAEQSRRSEAIFRKNMERMKQSQSAVEQPKKATWPTLAPTYPSVPSAEQVWQQGARGSGGAGSARATVLGGRAPSLGPL